MGIDNADLPSPPIVLLRTLLRHIRGSPLQLPTAMNLRLSSLLRNQVAQREIIDDILDILHPVLESIAPPAQDVVLQVKDLEACEDVLDELVDEDGSLIVPESDGIARKAGLNIT